MPAAPDLYRITDLNAAVEPSALSASRMTSKIMLPRCFLDVGPISFGHTDLSSHQIHEHPHTGAWAETRVEIPQAFVWTLRNAVVRSSHGIVTLDDHVLAETLSHVPPAELGGKRVDGGISFDPVEPAPPVLAAIHMLAAGHENYYHWMLDLISRFAVLDATHQSMPMLFPTLDKAFQQETITILQPGAGSLLKYSSGTAVKFDQLTYVPNLTGWGWRPNPALTSLFDRLRNAVGNFAYPYRRLYISRARNLRRPLANEMEIVQTLAAAGFEIVELDDVSLYDQIRLFAEASHVIAPHGAGLTNVVFCQPTAVICELHPAHYVNWCFRRLAALRGLRYGCLIGEMIGPWNEAWPHVSAWKVDLSDLLAILKNIESPGRT